MPTRDAPVFDDSSVVLPAVKAILATVLLALAVYQVLLMLVGRR